MGEEEIHCQSRPYEKKPNVMKGVDEQVRKESSCTHGKQTLMDMSEINSDTVIVGDFSTQLKINKKTSVLIPHQLKRCLS